MSVWWQAAGDAFDVVLIGDAGGAMAEAVALAGGRVVSRPEIGEPLDAVAGALVAVDLGGLAPMPLDLLSALTARADIFACDLDQLDTVAAEMLWADTQVLCAPSLADRIEALVLAAAHAGAPEAAVREGEGERLRRFGGEVARIAAVLARLARDQGAADVAERHAAFHPEPGGVPVAAASVRQAIRARRLRATFFGDGLFEDPAWDMLLDLFAAELEGGRVSVSSLCIAAHVAPTTALRWIGRLSDVGLFERRADPRDRRRAFIALSAQGSAAMRGYLGAMARAGLVLG